MDQLQINQFLVKDDEPFIMPHRIQEDVSMTLEGVSSVIDPSTLRWVGFSHFESDECGALNEWLRVAPHSQAVCSCVGAMGIVPDVANHDFLLCDGTFPRLRFRDRCDELRAPASSSSERPSTLCSFSHG